MSEWTRATCLVCGTRFSWESGTLQTCGTLCDQTYERLGAYQPELDPEDLEAAIEAAEQFPANERAWFDASDSRTSSSAARALCERAGNQSTK
jgi:hypothetical protein